VAVELGLCFWVDEGEHKQPVPRSSTEVAGVKPALQSLSKV